MIVFRKPGLSTGVIWNKKRKSWNVSVDLREEKEIEGTKNFG